jgi:hypothetical protein
MKIKLEELTQLSQEISAIFGGKVSHELDDKRCVFFIIADEDKFFDNREKIVEFINIHPQYEYLEDYVITSVPPKKYPDAAVSITA